MSINHRPPPVELPFQVSGGSMSEALHGEHFSVECGDCGIPFACDATNPPVNELAVCPNCGYERNKFSTDHLRAGDRVNLKRHVPGKSKWNRWDVMACRSPDDNRKRIVKRVVGLPGEHISIRHGDIYVDGVMSRKDLSQLRAMAIFVNDDRYRTMISPTPQKRWGFDDPPQWERDSHGFVLRNPDDANVWLEYQHWACMPSLQKRETAMPVKDNYGYNQAIARKLHAVSDLMLTCDVSSGNWQSLSLRLSNRYGEFQVQLNHSNETVVLTEGTDVIATSGLSQLDVGETVQLELAYCDGQILFAINQREIIEQVIDPDREPVEPTATPLAISARGEKIEVGNLRILRDVHYLDPGGLGRDWDTGGPLSANQYLLLGDNVPISEDSRSWVTPGVDEELILGKVLSTNLRQPAQQH